MVHQSKILIPTLRETPADLKTDSHQLLIRGGFIRQVSAGVYAYLPLALQVLDKMKQVIREEFNKLDGVEVQMPHLIPEELMEKSGRKTNFNEELFFVKDCNRREYILAPTAEELFASLIFQENLSYKKFPLHLYQIQTKFRDESKVRYGLLKAREFLMADAYSFHTSVESLQESYRLFEGAFQNIFTRLGITTVSIIGDNEVMGGEDSKEFVALGDLGDEVVFQSSKGDYAASSTMAKSFLPEKSAHGAVKPLEKVTLASADLKDFITQLPERLERIKAYPYEVAGEKVFILMPEDRLLNEAKIRRYFAGQVVKKIPETAFSCPVSFLSPIGLLDYKVYGDLSVKSITNGIYGGNQKDTYYINGNAPRDFTIVDFEDFQQVQAGDLAPDGEGILEVNSGIEVGHLFKLDDFYSQRLQGTFLDENSQKQPILMGSYGIGVSRLLQVIAQQHHDDKGLIWPKAIAPYDLHVIPVNLNESAQEELLTIVLEKIASTSYSVLVDDRNEHIGIKLTDSELIGCPLRIVIGKKANEGILEITLRKSGEKVEVKQEDLVEILPILYDSQI